MTERIRKVEQAVKEEVARILQRELKDPRVGFVTVTKVQVTPDLQQATIYFSFLEGHGQPAGATAAGTEAGLKSAQGFIRKLLGDRLRLRVTPQVRFRADRSVGETIRLSRILEDLRKEAESKEP